MYIRAMLIFKKGGSKDAGKSVFHVYAEKLTQKRTEMYN